MPHYSLENQHDAYVESQNLSKQNFENDVCCIHCEKFHYLKEKMDELILVCPNGKPALRLENFKKFSVKEFSGILKHHNENISKKGRPSHDSLWHLLFLTKVTVSTFVIRFAYGSYYSLHLLSWVFMSFSFFFVNFSIQFGKNDIREIANFTFFQLYHDFIKSFG